MSTDEQLVTCVRHTYGFIQTYFLFNLLTKFFKRNQFSMDILKNQSKAATVSVPKKKIFLKLSIL